MSHDEPSHQARRAAEALVNGCENASDIAEYHGVTHSTGNNYVEALREHVDVEYLPSEFRYEFDTDAVETVAMGGFETAEPEEPVDAGPDPDDLSERQQYIVNRIAADAPTRDELADDLGVDTRYVDAHLRDIREQGWQVNVDESSEAVSLAGDHTLRSSEHTGTRTRKANRWWELSHSQLVREFRGLRGRRRSNRPPTPGKTSSST